MESFDALFHRAAERKGGEANLNGLLSHAMANPDLHSLSDDRWLSAFTKKVFQSGFVWRVVEQKWPDFEEVFFNFDIEKVLMMPEDMLERKAQDKRIIRNFNKVKTIKENAHMIYDVQQEQGSFAKFVTDWPSDNIIGLWAHLKKHGQRLGGNTGPYALRAMGKDTFIVSRDVEAYFRAQKLIEGGIGSKTNQKKIQQHFNKLHKESGLDYCQLSRLVALSTGDNVVHLETAEG